MDTLRSVSHLQRELGDELFGVLVSSDNTELFRQFARSLVKMTLESTMTIGDRVYEILDFLHEHEGENSIDGDTMVARAKKMSANLGQEDGQYLLDHQDQIPPMFCGIVVFVLPGWRNPDDDMDVACLCWFGGRWVRHWRSLGRSWNGSVRLLRRKSRK